LFLTISMGVGVEGAKVTYMIEKDGKTTHDIATSNNKGMIRIPAKVGSMIVITMIAKDGAIAQDLPMKIVMEARKEYREIILK
ncbi:MAG: hypothetical protein FWC44_04030, partial [Methanomassiliicoccaceae archaeon]|nr:hypothetical protein [Methanomassiliicoccaceae archaeon]